MSRLMELFPRWPNLWESLDQWIEPFQAAPTTSVEPGYPAVNIFEKADKVYIEAELPGVKGEDLDISVTGQEVILSGKRVPPHQPEVTFTRQERPYGSFSRTITLPWEIDPDSVEASLHDGVLSVALGKTAKCRTKKVAVHTA